MTSLEMEVEVEVEMEVEGLSDPGNQPRPRAGFVQGQTELNGACLQLLD